MVATKTIVIAGIIIAVCVTALVVGIVLGTRNRQCSGDAALPVNVTTEHTFSQDLYTLVVSWDVPTEDADCAVSYMVIYDNIQNGSPVNQTVNVTMLNDTSVTIFSVEPCVTVTVHIFPKNEDGDVSSDHYMFNYTTPLESINAPTDIEFNANGENLEVSWTRPTNAGQCAVTYEVTVTTDSGEPEVETETDPNHNILDNSFCIRAGVSITALSEGLTSSSVSQEYTTPAVTILGVEPSTDNSALIVSWEPIPKPQCLPQYRIIQTVDGEAKDPIETELNEYSINLEYCADIQFTITAFVGALETQPATTDTTNEEPTEVSAVTNVQIVNRLITWEAPSRYTACALTYVLSASSDGANAETYTPTGTRYSVDDIEYCFSLDEIVLRADYNDVPGILTEPISFTEDNQVQDLLVVTSNANANQYTITWTPHAKQDECSIRYHLVYTIAEETESEVDEAIQASTYSFNKVFCNDGSVSVTPISDTLRGEEVIEELPAEYPNLSVTGASAIDGLITWTPVPEVDRCTITYEVRYSPDTGESVTLTPEENSVTVDPTAYCFLYDAYITVIVSGVASTATHITDAYDNQVEELAVITSPDNADEYFATWSPHRKADQCNIQYRVVYTLEGEEDDSVVDTRTGESEYTFNKVYCMAGTLSVTAVADNDVESGASVEELPSESQSAVITSLEASNGQVTWDPVEPVGRCTIQYQVAYNPDSSAPDTEIVETNSFTVPSESYCFKYDVTVTSIVSGQLGSSEFASDISDNQVEELTVITSPGNADEYFATWSPHRKADQCNIQYRVVYTLEGEEDDSEIDIRTGELEYTFNKVYCIAGTLSVTAVADNDVESGASVEDLPSESQSAVITSLEASNGQVTWNPVEPVGRCTIQYQVAYNPDSSAPATEIVETNSFTVPSESYCFMYEVTVTSIVSGQLGSPEFASDISDLNIENIEITTAPATNEISVTWLLHEKQDQCGIVYTAASLLSEETQAVVAGASTATLGIVYCESDTITVSATTSVNEVTLAGSDSYGPISPVAIGEVQGIEMVPNVDDETHITLSWLAPPYVGECALIYTVTADGTLVPDCDGITDTECEVEATCDMEISIRTDYGIDPVISVSTDRTYSCVDEASVIHA